MCGPADEPIDQRPINAYEGQDDRPVVPVAITVHDLGRDEGTTIATGVVNTSLTSRDRELREMVGRQAETYPTLRIAPEDGMRWLRLLFPRGQVENGVLVFFSLPTVASTNSTIEEIALALDMTPPGWSEKLSFLTVHTRGQTLAYGECRPTRKDIPYLLELRDSGWAAVQGAASAWFSTAPGKSYGESPLRTSWPALHRWRMMNEALRRWWSH